MPLTDNLLLDKGVEMAFMRPYSSALIRLLSRALFDRYFLVLSAALSRQFVRLINTTGLTGLTSPAVPAGRFDE